MNMWSVSISVGDGAKYPTEVLLFLGRISKRYGGEQGALPATICINQIAHPGWSPRSGGQACGRLCFTPPPDYHGCRGTRVGVIDKTSQAWN